MAEQCLPCCTTTVCNLLPSNSNCPLQRCKKQQLHLSSELHTQPSFASRPSSISASMVSFLQPRSITYQPSVSTNSTYKSQPPAHIITSRLPCATQTTHFSRQKHEQQILGWSMPPGRPPGTRLWPLGRRLPPAGPCFLRPQPAG